MWVFGLVTICSVGPGWVMPGFAGLLVQRARHGKPCLVLPLMSYSVIHEVCSRLEAPCSWDAVARPEGTAACSDINSFPRVWLMTSVSANRVGDAR